MLNAATWLMNLGVAAGAMLAGRSLVHYFQLESYQFPGYYRTLKRNAARAVLPGCLMTLAAVVAALLHGAAAGSDSWFVQLLLGVLSGAAAAGGGFLIGKVTAVRKAKKALVDYLQVNISQRSGRTYAGGLTKFEPREMERLIVPGPALLSAGVAL